MNHQVWIDHRGSGEPSSRTMSPVRNRDDLGIKPGGGLWTSSHHPDEVSSWVDWCRGEGFVPDGRREPVAYLLTPQAGLRVFVIDSYDDLAELVARYPRTTTPGVGLGFDPAVDYASVANEYDAVQLTDAGQWATRLSMPLSLYGWDCETVFWFRWCFSDVVSLGAVDLGEPCSWARDETEEAAAT